MSKIEELQELNRLNKEKTERDMASAVFMSVANTSYLLDKFSMWLFAGTGATAALFITQINSILSNMSITGFKACIFMLIVSSVFAFVAKYFSLKCQVTNETVTMVLEKTPAIIKDYTKEKDYIEENAREHGFKLDTDIDSETFNRELVRPFPKFIQRRMMRQIQKNKGDRQATYHQIIRAYHKQSLFTLLQALAFIGFMCFGGWFAGSLT